MDSLHAGFWAYIVIACWLAVSPGCNRGGRDLPNIAQGTVTPEMLVTKPDGLTYAGQNETPYTGPVVGFTGEQKTLEMNYVNGLADGQQTEWHPNGNKKSEIIWQSGLKQGAYRWWHDNGQLREEGTFRNNQKHGPVTGRDRQGRTIVSGNYDAGWFTGTKTVFADDGRKLKDVVFEHGVEVANREVHANRYLGAQVCAECHREKFESFRETAHHLTSRLANRQTVLGNFTPGTNEMKTGNPHLSFQMLDLADGFYQVSNQTADGTDDRQSARIDIVMGSGKIGQTFLHWHGSQLFELPISYFTEVDNWLNSPGYTDGEVNFWRPIIGRCLECHATYFESWPNEINSYSREGFVLGISCEKCHGPGSHHVEYHRAHPQQTESQHIVHPGTLDRDRQLEVCAQCHSGHGTVLQPSFSFQPGRPLGDYIELESSEELNRIGVHSNNQLARLGKSRCFVESEMTCISCHDPHYLERGNVGLFSQRCLQCHETAECGMSERLGERIASNCIDCHMPKRRDIGTPLASAEGTKYPLMREHHIAIYEEDTEQVLSAWDSVGEFRRPPEQFDETDLPGFNEFCRAIEVLAEQAR